MQEKSEKIMKMEGKLEKFIKMEENWRQLRKWR